MLIQRKLEAVVNTEEVKGVEKGTHLIFEAELTHFDVVAVVHIKDVGS